MGDLKLQINTKTVKPAATGPAASPLPNSPVTSLKPNAAPSGPVISTISTGSILGDIIKDENPLSTKTTDFIKSLAPNYNPEKFLETFMALSLELKVTVKAEKKLAAQNHRSAWSYAPKLCGALLLHLAKH